MHDELWRSFWEWSFYLGGGLALFSLATLILDTSVWTTGKEARNFTIFMVVGVLAVLASYVFG